MFKTSFKLKLIIVYLNLEYDYHLHGDTKLHNIRDPENL